MKKTLKDIIGFPSKTNRDYQREIEIANRISLPVYEDNKKGFTCYPSRLVFSPHNIRFIPSGSYSWELIESIKGERKEIKDFSRKSRANFLKKLDCSDFQGRLFFTLTYPRDCVPSVRLHSSAGVSRSVRRSSLAGFTAILGHKKNYGFRTFFPCDLAFSQCKAFMRSVDRLSYQFRHDCRPLWFWKREFQKDGTIHFHLLTNIIPDAIRFKHSQWFYKGKGKKGYYKKGRSNSFSWELLPVDFISKCQNIWAHIIGEKVTGKNNSMDIAPVRSQAGSIHYMAKYIDKKNECTECPKMCINLGRYWGIQNRKEYRKVEPIILKLPTKKAEKIRAFLHCSLDSAGYNFKYQLKKFHYCKSEWFKPENLGFKNKLIELLNDCDVYIKDWNNSVFNNYTDL